MKVMEFIKYHLTSVNKALNMVMPVSLFIDFHRLQCHAINNYHNYSIWVFVNSYLATIFFVLKMLSAFFLHQLLMIYIVVVVYLEALFRC